MRQRLQVTSSTEERTDQILAADHQLAEEVGAVELAAAQHRLPLRSLGQQPFEYRREPIEFINELRQRHRQ